MTKWNDIEKLIKEMKQFNDYEPGDDKDDERTSLIQEAVEKGELTIIDGAHVMLASFHGERLIRFVGSIVDINSLKFRPNVPKLYSSEDTTKVSQPWHTTNYSAEYLKYIWQLGEKLGGSVEMTFSTSYPLMARVGDEYEITFLLAPRVIQ